MLSQRTFWDPPTADRHALLNELRQQLHDCQACPLGLGRTSLVFGEGNAYSPLVLVGEGPGANEDELGRPFVGAAGQLLDRILVAAGIVREEVYITNVVMCRPPGNRYPAPAEIAACQAHLQEKLRIIAPLLVVCLGALAAATLIAPSVRVTREHGKTWDKDGVLYLPTFHPAALLRDPGKKPLAWEDFKRVRDLYQGFRETAVGVTR